MKFQKSRAALRNAQKTLGTVRVRVLAARERAAEAVRQASAEVGIAPESIFSRPIDLGPPPARWQQAQRVALAWVASLLLLGGSTLLLGAVFHLALAFWIATRLLGLHVEISPRATV